MELINYGTLPFKYAESVQAVKIERKTVYLLVNDNDGDTFNIEITVLKHNVLRVRLYKDEFIPLDYDFINKDFVSDNNSCKIEEDIMSINVYTDEFRLKIGKPEYSFSLFDINEKQLLCENLNDVNPVGEGEDRVPPMGYSYNRDGRVACYNLCYHLGVYENVYGLGERFTAFNKREQTVRMLNRDALGVRNSNAYKNIPFYVSSSGYGLFVNSHRDTEFNFGSRSMESVNIHIPGEAAEYYIITGNMKQIVSTYTMLTGPAALPPKWSFGVWYSNSFKASSRQAIEEDANYFREHNIPCDVIHFDCYWLRDNMWCDFKWDEKMYPDHEGMLRGLKDNHFKVCVWINPYVTVVSEMYEEGKEKEYFIKNKEGEPYLSDLWHGLLPLCAIVDFTNTDACRWFKDKVQGLLKQGINAVKTDFGEDIPLDSVFFNGKSGLEMRNVYSHLYNTVVFEASSEIYGENTMVWGRSGFAGMQRYPVCWSGDPNSSYEGMASVLKSGLSHGLSGVPFWSHDIGGFYGKVDAQVFVRWAQFGLLSSHSRFHGTTTRQPWAYGEEVERIITDFISLRYRLMPYILKSAQQCVRDGAPFIRPMVMENDQDPQTANIWDQYYMGDDIIVAPVFGPADTIRSVYIPDGEWVDWFTGETYSGRHLITVKCPLSTIPLLMRKGINIPMDEKPRQYIQE